MVFILLYLAFTFLNGFFLRESLIFLFVLLAVSCSCSDRSIRALASLLPLVLTRPHGILLFLRPWLSILLLLCFLLFMRHLYAAQQIRDNGFLSLFNEYFWKDIGSYILITLANLNPFASLGFHLSRGEYLQTSLMTLGSIPTFAVFAQMGLALLLQEYRHAYLSRLWTGMLCLLIMYGSLGLAIDKRIFISLFAPFIIFANPSLLRLRNLLWLIGVWIFMLIINLVVGSST